MLCTRVRDCCHNATTVFIAGIDCNDPKAGSLDDTQPWASIWVTLFIQSRFGTLQDTAPCDQPYNAHVLHHIWCIPDSIVLLATLQIHPAAAEPTYFLPCFTSCSLQEVSIVLSS